MAANCMSCTSILDSLDGTAPHAAQRQSLVVVATSPIDSPTLSDEPDASRAPAPLSEMLAE